MNNPKQTKNIPRPTGDPQFAGLKIASTILHLMRLNNKMFIKFT